MKTGFFPRFTLFIAKFRKISAFFVLRRSHPCIVLSSDVGSLSQIPQVHLRRIGNPCQDPGETSSDPRGTWQGLHHSGGLQKKARYLRTRCKSYRCSGE